MQIKPFFYLKPKFPSFNLPCKLIVAVVLLPRSRTTTDVAAAILAHSYFLSLSVYYCSNFLVCPSFLLVFTRCFHLCKMNVFCNLEFQFSLQCLNSKKCIENTRFIQLRGKNCKFQKTNFNERFSIGMYLHLG